MYIKIATTVVLYIIENVHDLFDDYDAPTQVATTAYQVTFCAVVVQDTSKIFKDLEDYDKWSYKKTNTYEDTINNKNNEIEKPSVSISYYKCKMRKWLHMLRTDKRNNVSEDQQIYLYDFTYAKLSNKNESNSIHCRKTKFAKKHNRSPPHSIEELNSNAYNRIFVSLNQSLLFLNCLIEINKFISSKERLLQDNSQSYIFNQQSYYNQYYNSNNFYERIVSQNRLITVDN